MGIVEATTQQKSERRAQFSILHPQFARVGFWRALLEITLVGNALVLLVYPLHNQIAPLLKDLLTYLSLGIYSLAAWRLEAGEGGFWRRLGRVLGWLALFSLINGIIGWLVIEYVPFEGRILGMRLDDVRVSLPLYLLAGLVLTVSLFMPVRVLLALWALGRARLRWQLTFSYLLIGILTSLFVPLLVVLYIAILSLAPVPPITPPIDIARQLANGLGPQVRQGVTPGQLDGLLASILDGRGRLPMPADQDIDEQAADLEASQVRRITLLDRYGQVLSSAGREPFPSGEALPASAGDQLYLLLAAASEQGPEGCTNGRPSEGILADTAACVITEADGGPAAIVLIESTLDSSVQVGAMVGRIIRITLLGTSLTLNVAIFVLLLVMPIALGAGYLLARRLTRRLERLTAATGALAAGQLDQRVEIDSQDELGRLSSDFNQMAARLAERERALADAAAQAENLLRANKRLVADVSHELRNPLATLRGYLEALEQSHGDRLPPGDMQVIRNETQRLTTLVEDLFTVARAEAQQLTLTITSVDVGALAHNLAATLAPLARRERQIELITEIANDLPLARADQTRLEQVLRNLAQNALRYTPPGGIVVFAAQADATSVTIQVADTGVGIGADELGLVFERFYRGDSSRARETGGAGLGLSLVKELVEAMGGSVAVESEVGRGSLFRVVLQRT